MEFQIELITQTRTNFENLVQALPVGKLNKIPEGYNNNILWNFGHVIVTQQLLSYGLCGLTFTVNEEIIKSFRKGSSPADIADKCDAVELLHISKHSMEAFLKDLEKGLFQNFKPYETSYGISLANMDEVLRFIPAHEALHLGYAMAMRKVV